MEYFLKPFSGSAIRRKSEFGGKGFAGTHGELAETLVPARLDGGPDFGCSAARTRDVEWFLDHGVISLLPVLVSRCMGRV